MRSRCFLESGDRLSCQTCHDPHSNASTDKKQYEKICLSCHSPARAATASKGVGLGKACPVNPHSGCIPCHMPKREVTPDAPIAMADHFIRIHRSDSSASGESQVGSEADPFDQ
jgi:predicted CXXCH cytochrome family protein